MDLPALVPGDSAPRGPIAMEVIGLTGTVQEPHLLVEQQVAGLHRSVILRNRMRSMGNVTLNERLELLRSDEKGSYFSLRLIVALILAIC